MFDVMTRAELRAEGLTARGITRAVREGTLIRARQDAYLAGDAPPELVSAVRVGGRLGCVSLLRLLGVFVFDATGLHVHMERGDSRMRSAQSCVPLPGRDARGDVVLHWHRFVEPPTAGCVSIVDALIHAVRCQPPRHAIATLDSALNLGLVCAEQLDDVFAHLPARYGTLRSFIDARAQSGPETLVRLMALQLGCRVDLQTRFDGVGCVDLVLDGWLVVECDSRAFHESWAQQLKDRRRDRVLARMGCNVLRLTAEDILYRPDEVFASLRGLVRGARRFR